MEARTPGTEEEPEMASRPEGAGKTFSSILLQRGRATQGPHKTVAERQQTGRPRTVSPVANTEVPGRDGRWGLPHGLILSGIRRPTRRSWEGWEREPGQTADVGREQGIRPCANASCVCRPEASRGWGDWWPCRWLAFQIIAAVLPPAGQCGDPGQPVRAFPGSCPRKRSG